MTVKCLKITFVKRDGYSSDSATRINSSMPYRQVLASVRKDELKLLDKMRREARLPERYPHQ